MQCPVDGTTLLMSNREGVEIDYCPSCRGVWLDRGELDKIVERTAPASSAAAAPPASASAPSRGDRDHDDRRGHDDDRYPRSKRRGSFLGDIFDF